jgi:hypothetical protein
MSESFDAYYKWLGIPPSQQPPDHYRLLGLQLYEGDLEVISAGAVQRMNWVRKFQKGPHGSVAQNLVQEITSAWAVLLNAQNKANYDNQLKRCSVAVAGLMTADNLNYPPETLSIPVDLQEPPSAPQFVTERDEFSVPPQTSQTIFGFFVTNVSHLGCARPVSRLFRSSLTWCGPSAFTRRIYQDFLARARFIL